MLLVLAFLLLIIVVAIMQPTSVSQVGGAEAVNVILPPIHDPDEETLHDAIDEAQAQDLNKDVLSNHNDRLIELEKYLCQLKTETVRTDKSGVNENQEHIPKSQQQTSKVNTCPVCPMYSQTHPVNVFEIGNPAGVGPSY